MGLPMYLVSTFTTEFAGGNPAGVVLVDAERETAWYQAIAVMLNQPATAFVHPVPGGHTLRWFSPICELPLCGHGTVAATHILYETGAAQPGTSIELSTQARGIAVRREDGVCWISLDASPVRQAAAPAEVLAALRIADAEWFGQGEDDVIVVLDSLAAVDAVSPDFESLRVLTHTRTIVTAAGGDGVDFTSRVFPPRVGVPEDQVTGTAHAALAPYWSQRLGKTRLRARQASKRGGLVELDVSRGGVVAMGGRVVTVAEGQLLS